MVAQYKVRIAVARAARKAKGVPVRYIDDMGKFDDDGAYVRLEVLESGSPSEVLILSTETFYTLLNRVMAIAMPGSSSGTVQ